MGAKELPAKRRSEETERSRSEDSYAEIVGDGDSSAREGLDLILQRTILGLVLAALVWSALALGAVRWIDFLPAQVMTALALAVWVARFWTQRPFRLFWPPVCWGVYAFVCYALVRSQLVDIPFVARREMWQVIVYGCLFLVIVNNLNRRESTTIFTVTLVTLAMLLSLFAVYQFATHAPYLTFYTWATRLPQYINRGSGTFVNPNNFAGFLEMLIPLGLSYILLSRLSPIAKVMMGYATLVMIAGLCVSVSRGAMAATAIASAGMCVALLFEGGLLLPTLVALALLIGGGIWVNSSFGAAQRRFNRLHDTVELRDDRRDYWPIAVEIFQEHKLWGAGPGHFDQEFYFHRPEKMQLRLTYAHNEYLNTLADWGLAGLALIGGVVAAVFYGAWRTWHSVRRSAGDLGRRRSDKGAFIVGAAFGLVALALHCIVDFDMHLPADALLAVGLLALVTAQWRFVTERSWKNPGLIGKWLLGGAALAVAGSLVTEAVGRGREQYWVEQAQGAERILEQAADADSPDAVGSPARQAAFQEKIAALTKACDLDPTDGDACYDLGLCHWNNASQGATGYQLETYQAMESFARAMKANPLAALPCVKYGMCLDWLDRHEEADVFFRKARVLDPNGWYVAFCQGKHLLEVGKLDEARKAIYTAYLRRYGDELTLSYLLLVDRRIAEAAAKKQGGLPR
ncbi:MAG TPA: O-antigen ligase family protein [Verrucomicrobiae bacterium]|jgi:O-antigen ligase|nr:O-antigen ligase family protein [Verrucomicrobiae bacterium]